MQGHLAHFQHAVNPLSNNLAPTAPLSNNLASALPYMGVGWRLLPCWNVPGDPDRHKAPLTPNGFHDATADPARVEAWATQFPGCLWGGIPPAGICIIDADERPQKGKHGGAVLDMLGFNRDDAGMVVETPSGGHHFYMAGDLPTTNSAAGIDTRGADGKGYIVLPGQVDANGGQYRIARQSSQRWKPVPACITGLVSNISQGGDYGPMPTPSPHGIDLSTLPVGEAVKATIRDGVAKGERSEALYRAAMALARGGVSAADILSVLSDPANRISEKAREHRPEWLWRHTVGKAVKACDPATVFSGNVVPLPAATPAAPPASNFINTNDLMMKKFDPVRWIVPGYVPEGLTVLAGRQKLGKTWLAIDWSIAVGSGGYAMGKIQVEQGDVLYIDMENGERRVQRRIDALYPQGFCRPDLSRLQWALEAPMLNAGFIDFVDQWRRSVPNARFVVIDVLQRIKQAGSTSRNAYENDYSIFAPLQKWAMLNGIGVVGLHHTKKGGADDPVEALSGSNGLSAVADTTMLLDRDGNGTTLYVRGRDVEEKETAMTFTHGRWNMNGDAMETRVTSERYAILQALKDSNEPMSPNEIAAVTGMKNANVRKLLHNMVKADEIRKEGYGRYLRSSNTGNTGNTWSETQENQGFSSVTGAEGTVTLENSTIM